MNAAYSNTASFTPPGTAGNTRRRTAGGFTLLELLVVTAILMLLTAMVVTNLEGLKRSRRLLEAVDLVTATLGYAREQAVGGNKIIHVRLENRGPNDQWISVYYFPRAADALNAVTEENVWDDELIVGRPSEPDDNEGRTGWNPGKQLRRPADEAGKYDVYANVLLTRRQLPQGTWFETQYDPGTEEEPKLWDFAKDRLRRTDEIHDEYSLPPYESLYYSGKWDDEGVYAPYPVLDDDGDDDPDNVVPRGVYDGTRNPQKLLIFLPDGTAVADVVILIRNEKNLRYVRVYKGGRIVSGSIEKLDELKTVLERP